MSFRGDHYSAGVCWCFWVRDWGLCVSLDTEDRCYDTQPGREDRGQKGEGIEGFSVIKLPSRKPQGLVAEEFWWSWKPWREQQQCFFVSLDWPLDILDTSRCVRCFRPFFFFSRLMISLDIRGHLQWCHSGENSIRAFNDKQLMK